VAQQVIQQVLHVLFATIVMLDLNLKNLTAQHVNAALLASSMDVQYA
jgi:hypothetical protein